MASHYFVSSMNVSSHRFQTEWETGLNSCNLFIWNSPKIKLFVYQISTFGKYIVRVEGDALAFQDITIRCSWNAMCFTFVQLAENWLKIIMIESIFFRSVSSIAHQVYCHEKKLQFYSIWYIQRIRVWSTAIVFMCIYDQNFVFYVLLCMLLCWQTELSTHNFTSKRGCIQLIEWNGHAPFVCQLLVSMLALACSDFFLRFLSCIISVRWIRMSGSFTVTT